MDVSKEFVENSDEDKFLVFTLGDEEYGIEITYVTEIVGIIQSIIPTPDMPEYIKGVINLRGKIIAVMDVGKRFKKEQIEFDDRTCIIVVDINSMLLGLLVNRVTDVKKIAKSEIDLLWQIGDCSKRFIKGIGKLSDKVYMIIECNNLLMDDDCEILQNPKKQTAQ